MTTRGVLDALYSASLATFALLLYVTRADAAATSVDVEVVDISGGEAYVTTGSTGSLAAGTAIQFGRIKRRVTRASRTYAVVSARGLRIGSRGKALVAPDNRSTRRLTEPRALSAFVGQWPATVPPATLQHPKRVPFPTLATSKPTLDASLTSSAMGFLPLRTSDGVTGRGDLRGRLQLSAETRIPLEARADFGVQTWFGRYATGISAGDARPPFQVREAALSVGAVDDYRAHFGRLRYAAANLGPLDGARLEAASLGPLRISGFGGLLPDPIDGAVDSNTGRFGLDLNLRSERDGSIPELTLVAHGSTFHGEVDERRIFASTQLWPGDHRLQAYAEAALFDRDNPWRRPTFDLSAAGADADLRFGAVRLNARVDMRKPERSYWLANSFPASWLCSTASVRSAIECAGNDDTRYLMQALVGWTGQAVAAQLDGMWITSSDPELGKNATVHAMLRTARPLGPLDLGMGGSFETGNLLLTNVGLRADAGLRLAEDRLHLTAYYRPARVFYMASRGARWEHGTGLRVHVSPTPALSLDLMGDARLGVTDALLAMLLLHYRFVQ